jgi:antitoxin (DNA-binding transcriptional repressor) of toxin-antitoxin stability system
MKRVRSDEARRTFRALLNEVEHAGAHVQILRYETPTAVLVPVQWYEAAQAALGKVGR